MECLISFKEVLSFVFSAVAIFNSMLRTTMVACEAHGATVVPLRESVFVERDIVHRTHFGAFATRHTSVFDDMKRFR